MSQLCRRKLVGGTVPVNGGEMADFRANDGTDSGKLLIQGLLNRSRGVTDDICKGLLGNGEWVFLIGGVRDEIHPARQDLAHGADLGRDMLDAV